MKPDICGTAVCKNIPGDFECECAEGYRYNPTLKSCEGRVVVVSLLMAQRVGLSPAFLLEALVLLEISNQMFYDGKLRDVAWSVWGSLASFQNNST